MHGVEYNLTRKIAAMIISCRYHRHRHHHHHHHLYHLHYHYRDKDNTQFLSYV